jgi:hypothetical protein
MTTSGPRFGAERKRILELAVKYRLPAIYSQKDHVDEGGLMSYGVDWADQYRKAAYYVDKILKGTKPADLPVQQATKFEFVINLKAAKQIGLTLSPEFLATAPANLRYLIPTIKRGGFMQLTALSQNINGVIYQNDSSTPVLVTVQVAGVFSTTQPVIFNSTANPADQALLAKGVQAQELI